MLVQVNAILEDKEVKGIRFTDRKWKGNIYYYDSKDIKHIKIDTEFNRVDVRFNDEFNTTGRFYFDEYTMEFVK